MYKILSIIVIFTFFSSKITANDLIKQISLPKNFSIKIYSKVPNARQMAISSSGILFVGSRTAGKVYAIQDSNSDGYGDTIYIIASGLRLPTGLAYKYGNLYVAAVNEIYMFPNIEQNLNSPKKITIKNDLPYDSGHGWKYMKISKNDRLYFNIGAPCNVCKLKDPYGTISSIKLDGSDFQIHARGIRNSVGFLWHPVTNDIWFTDNGRDGLGDNTPPCELNRMHKDGDNFGFPYCYGKNIRDKTIEFDKDCNIFIPTALDLEAHVAPLGIDINFSELFSSFYKNTIFIAEHGSWNRSKRIGYRISYAKLNDKNNKIIAKGIFAEGWLKKEKVAGRPVDILFNKDKMFVSDDLTGYIYIIKHKN